MQFRGVNIKYFTSVSTLADFAKEDDKAFKWKSALGAQVISLNRQHAIFE